MNLYVILGMAIHAVTWLLIDEWITDAAFSVTAKAIAIGCLFFYFFWLSGNSKATFGMFIKVVCLSCGVSWFAYVLKELLIRGL